MHFVMHAFTHHVEVLHNALGRLSGGPIYPHANALRLHNQYIHSFDSLKP